AEHAAHAVYRGGPAGSGPARPAASNRQPVPGARRRLGVAGGDRERTRAARIGGRDDERPMMNFRRILPVAVGAAVVVAVGAYVVYGQQQQQQQQKRTRANQDQPAPVLAARVSIADVPIYLDTVGNTKALNTVTVRAQVGGQIVKVGFKEGQDVQRGFVLA